MNEQTKGNEKRTKGKEIKQQGTKQKLKKKTRDEEEE